MKKIIAWIVAGIILFSLACLLDGLLGPSYNIFPFFFTLPFKVAFTGFVFLLAFIIHRLAWRIAGGLLHSSLWIRIFLWFSNRLKTSQLGLEVAETGMRTERQKTIQYLVASIISVTAFVVAGLLSLSQFLTPEALALFTGLFTAAFSLGARPLIADMLSGVS